MSKLAFECAMVGLGREGYGFSTGQQGNKSIDYYRYKIQVFRHGCYSVLQGFMSASSISLDEWSVGYNMIHCQVVCYNISDMYVQLSFMQQLDVSGPLGASWIVFSSWHGLLGCGSWYQSGQSVQSGCTVGWCKCGQCVSVVSNSIDIVLVYTIIGVQKDCAVCIRSIGSMYEVKTCHMCSGTEV
jgi:hypothetical protein